jgi:hypothetical protein
VTDVEADSLWWFLTPPSRLARAALNYHVVSYPEAGRTSGSVSLMPALPVATSEGGSMEPIVERSCGLDVHQASVH